MNREVNINAPLFDGNGLFVLYTFTDPSTPTVIGDFNFLYITLSGTDFHAQRAQILASVAAYATTKGYTVTNTIWYLPGDATTTDFGFMTAADKTKLNSLSGGVYKSYQAIISQSGTSAPSASQMVTDFGATTFTWARSGIGAYTLTASTAIFTSGKTGILFSPSNSPLNNISGVRTSSTVLTFTTSQLNLLALGVGNIDSLLAGLVEVRVYP